MIYKIDVSTDPSLRFWNITELPNGSVKCYDPEWRDFVIEDPENMYNWGMTFEVSGLSVYIPDTDPIAALTQVIRLIKGKKWRNPE